MSQLDICLLGNFSVRWQGQAIAPLYQPRMQSLLAYLILHRDRPQTRNQLAFLYWPESSEKQAHANLRKAIHSLRSQIPNSSSYLLLDEKAVQWRINSDFTLDVLQFEAQLAKARSATDENPHMRVVEMEQAVQLYRGDLLPDCYEDWIAPVRQRLHRQFIDLLATLAEAHEQLRNYNAAIVNMRRLLQQDPLHEEAYRSLMRLYLLADDRINALRIYADCETILQRELGVLPSAQTKQLYVQLVELQHKTHLQPTEKSRTIAKPETQLVGRHQEWQRLVANWQIVNRGESRFLWVKGEPGIGKTRLSEEFASWVDRQGFAAAYARSYAAEGRLAFDPIAAWLRSGIFDAEFANMGANILREVARLLPELLNQHPTIEPPAPLSESWQRRHFFEILAWLFVANRKAIVLILDDLQWCDQETLEWLHYLFRYDMRCPLLLIGTARPGEIDTNHPLNRLVKALQQQGKMDSFELLPFNHAETAQLAEQLAEQPLLADQLSRLHQISEGNPLLVQEIMHSVLMDRRSPSEISGVLRLSDAKIFTAKMQAIIEVRLNNLTSEASQLVAAAAIIGRSFSLSLLRLVLNQNDETLLTALDELEQRRIVREQNNDDYDFSHDKIREVALGSIRKNRRQFLHLKVAEALETLNADKLWLLGIRIATHFRESSQPNRAINYYMLALRKAEFGFGNSEAEMHLQQGLKLIRKQPRNRSNITLEIAMLLALGRLLNGSQSWSAPAAIAAFEEARALAIEINNPDQLLRSQNFLRMCYGNQGKLWKAMELAESNLTIALQLNEEHVTDTHGILGLLYFCLGNLPQAEVHLVPVIETTKRNFSALQDKPLLSTSLMYTGTFHIVLVNWLMGYHDRALEQWQMLLNICEPIMSVFERASWYEFGIMLFCCRQEWADTLHFAEQQLQISEQYEYPFYVLMGKFYTHIAATRLTNQPADLSLLQKCLDDTLATNTVMHMPFMLGIFADICLRDGAIETAQAALDQASRLIDFSDERFWEADILRLRGEIAAQNGAISEAQDFCKTAIQIAQKQSAKSLELRAATCLARSYQASGKIHIAKETLTPIYNWFNEGHSTADLLHARHLLEKLNTTL